MAVSVASHQGQAQQRLGLSNAKDAHNKHIVLVKLTDSSLEALTNYIKHANKVGIDFQLKKILKSYCFHEKNHTTNEQEILLVKTYGRVCLKSWLRINFREFFLQPYCIHEKHTQQINKKTDFKRFNSFFCENIAVQCRILFQLKNKFSRLFSCNLFFSSKKHNRKTRNGILLP